MKLINFTIATILIGVITGCAHGIAKGNFNDGEAEDSVDTIEVDTVFADSVLEDVDNVYYDPEAKISYYEDDMLYFRIPSGYQCVQHDDGVIYLVNESDNSNCMAFDYYDVRPNENAESAVKRMVIELLQRFPNGVLSYSSDIPVLPENADIRNQYLAIVTVEDEQYPATITISGELLKNGHLYLITMMVTNEDDMKMFTAVLRTVKMR